MNCRTFARILADLQEGTLSPGDRAAAAAHASACDRCRRLRAVAEGRIDVLSEEAGRDLARAIVQRTSGSACPRAEACLCDFVDGVLDEVSSQLVTVHLESCTDCRALAVGLAELKQTLPEFAELDPGRGFTRAVVAQTSAYRPFRPDLRSRLLAWWTRMVQRPRFSFEAAYLGTLVLVLAFGNPVFPTGNLALEKLGSSKVVRSARGAISERFPSGWKNAQAPPLHFAHGLAEGVSQKGKAAVSLLDGLLTRGGQLSASSYNWQVRTVATWIRQAKDALCKLWSRVALR